MLNRSVTEKCMVALANTQRQPPIKSLSDINAYYRMLLLEQTTAVIEEYQRNMQINADWVATQICKAIIVEAFENDADAEAAIMPHQPRIAKLIAGEM